MFGQSFWNPLVARLQAQRGQGGPMGGEGRPQMPSQEGGFRMPFGQGAPQGQPWGQRPGSSDPQSQQVRPAPRPMIRAPQGAAPMMQRAALSPTFAQNLAAQAQPQQPQQPMQPMQQPGLAQDDEGAELARRQQMGTR